MTPVKMYFYIRGGPHDGAIVEFVGSCLPEQSELEHKMDVFEMEGKKYKIQRDIIVEHRDTGEPVYALDYQPCS